MPADAGYAKGVPMGGDLLTAPAGKSPTFLAAGEAVGVFLAHAVQRACIDRHSRVKVGVAKQGARRIAAPAVGRVFRLDHRCHIRCGNPLLILGSLGGSEVRAKASRQRSRQHECVFHAFSPVPFDRRKRIVTYGVYQMGDV